MNLLFSFVLVLIHGLVGVGCTFDPENVVYQIKKPYKKNTFVCDLRKQNDLEYKMLNPYCFSNAHSFTFTLTVKDKRRSTFGSSSNLKSLISTLRDNAMCNLKHMKVSLVFLNCITLYLNSIHEINFSLMPKLNDSHTFNPVKVTYGTRTRHLTVQQFRMFT